MFKSRPSSVPVIKTLFVPPKILVSQNALVKMKYYVQVCDKEIGWLGVAQREDNIIFISDVFLFKQEVGAATCEITPEGLQEFATKLLQQENGMEIWNSIALWGHSHVNMGVSPSGQDDMQMNVFGESGMDWFVRVIANKSGDMEFTLYDYKQGYTATNIAWDMLFPNEVQIKEQIELEIKEKVTPIKYNYLNNTVGFNNNKRSSLNNYYKSYETVNKVINQKKEDSKQTIITNINNIKKNNGKTKNKKSDYPYYGTFNDEYDDFFNNQNSYKDIINGYEDMFEFFTEDEIVEIADCGTAYEAEILMEEYEIIRYGSSFFGEEDCFKIYKYAKKYVKEEYLPLMKGDKK